MKCTFSPIYCIQFVTTLILHTRSSHLRDPSQRSLKIYLALWWHSYCYFFLFCVLVIILENYVHACLFFSITFVFPSVPLFSVPTLPLLSCLLSYYTLCITLLPSTFLHVKTTWSCDPECLDIAWKINS